MASTIALRRFFFKKCISDWAVSTVFFSMVNYVHQRGVRDTENLSTMTEQPGISSPATELCHPCHHQIRNTCFELKHLLRRVGVFSSRGKPNIYPSHPVTQTKSVPVKIVLTNIRNCFEESQSIMLTLTQVKSIPVKTVLTNIRNWFEESGQSIMLTLTQMKSIPVKTTY